MLQIDFFHDCICSFCFPMSARMRKAVKQLPGLDIRHRSFALGWTGEDFVRSFGSREAVKPEVLEHWQAANQNDEAHRFQIAGMAKTDFVFPISRPALIAAKAAGIVGGEAAYWDAFDAIQHKLFVQNQNIEELSVLAQAIGECGMDVDAWRAQYGNPQTEQAVLADLAFAQKVGVHSVPALLVEGKYLLNGAIPEESLLEALRKIAAYEGKTIE